MTSASFSIVEMNPSDREEFRHLLKKSWTETYVSELGSDIATHLMDQLAQDDIAGLAPNTDETVFIARGTKGLQGCAVSAARQGITYLWGFYVLQEFQRKGIGRELLKKAVRAHGRENSVHVTVLKSSVTARRFYNAVGFRKASDEQFEIVPGKSFPAEKMIAPATQIIK